MARVNTFRLGSLRTYVSRLRLALLRLVLLQLRCGLRSASGKPAGTGPDSLRYSKLTVPSLFKIHPTRVQPEREL
jgi:hypothetical protein